MATRNERQNQLFELMNSREGAEEIICIRREVSYKIPSRMAKGMLVSQMITQILDAEFGELVET